MLLTFCKFAVDAGRRLPQVHYTLVTLIVLFPWAYGQAERRLDRARVSASEVDCGGLVYP